MTASSGTNSPRLLIVGGQASGKTTYRTQIYQRIEHFPGELQLVKSVQDMTAISPDVDRLVQGLQPMHTELATYHSTTFHVQNRAGDTIALEFADYGGEQISRMAELNSVPVEWQSRTQESDAWLFVLRADTLRPTKSFMKDYVEVQPSSKPEAELAESGKSPEFMAIDTLQRLLFTRGASLAHPLRMPRLGVLLSCWDELSPAEIKSTPAEFLKKRAPLLSNFLESNWFPEGFRLWGLSSTGRKLPEHDPDREFSNRGPQNFGYIVRSNSDQDTDLTAPINWLIAAAE